MARYQVRVIERPEGWQPAVPDDVPPQPGSLGDVLAESDALFASVRTAIEHNRSPERHADRRWAVVVEPGSFGQTWREARLATPITYKVMPIWWPSGWEPGSPLDVPNCVWKVQAEAPSQRQDQTTRGTLRQSGQRRLQEPLTYRRALATVRALNRQSMDHATATWYVVTALENEPVSQTVSQEASGLETAVAVRRLHVVRPEPGGGKGDCAHCPAHAFECAREDWTSQEQTIAEAQTHTPSR